MDYKSIFSGGDMEAVMRLKILVLLLLFAPLGFLGAQTFVCSVDTPDPSLGVFLGTANARYYYMGMIGGRSMPSYANVELGSIFFMQRNWQERLAVWISSNHLMGAGSYTGSQTGGSQSTGGQTVNHNDFERFSLPNPASRFVRYTSGAIQVSEKRIHFAPWPNGIDRYESKMYLSKNRALFAPYIQLQPNSYFQGESPFTIFGVSTYDSRSDIVFETVIYYIGNRAVSTNVRILAPNFSQQSYDTSSWYAINIDVR
jgi:hypothetical protein